MTKKASVIFSHTNVKGDVFICSNCGIEVPQDQTLYDNRVSKDSYYIWPLYCLRCGAFFSTFCKKGE